MIDDGIMPRNDAKKYLPEWRRNAPAMMLVATKFESGKARKRKSARKE